jgi:hypothetical protein
MKVFQLFLTVCILLAFIACKKTTSDSTGTVTGVVMAVTYDMDMTTIQDTAPATDMDVNLVKITENYSNYDHQKLAYKGTYKFLDVNPGTYQIEVYSDDTTSLASFKQIAMVKDVILKSGNDAVVDTIQIIKRKDVDKGFATITGKVMQSNIKDDNNDGYISPAETVPVSVVPAQDLDIYLAYNNHEGYDIKTRTDENGNFRIPNLIKGKYKIYMLYKALHPNKEAEKSVVNTLSVTLKNQEITLHNDTVINYYN